MKGISINVGLNDVTSNVFSAPSLKGCVKDAEEMFNIATARGFDATLILGKEATFDRVVNAVSAAAQKLEAGDLFLFSFAGHGTFKVVANGDETDHRDESIVLTDHFLIDNFWRSNLWPKFKPGVRTVAVADCCHAETSLLSMNAGSSRRSVRRFLPDAERQKEFDRFKSFYANQLASAEQIGATHLFLSACKDDEEALETDEHGDFTQALLKVWDNGNFDGNYNEFIEKIREVITNDVQTPILIPVGDPDFSTEKPFTIQ